MVKQQKKSDDKTEPSKEIPSPVSTAESVYNAGAAGDAKVNNAPSERDAAVDATPVPGREVGPSSDESPVLLPPAAMMPDTPVISPSTDSDPYTLPTEVGIPSMLTLLHRTPRLERTFYGVNKRFANFDNTQKSRVTAQVKFLISTVTALDKLRLAPDKITHPYRPEQRIGALNGTCGYANYFSDVEKLPDGTRQALQQILAPINVKKSATPFLTDILPVFALPEEINIIRMFDKLQSTMLTEVEDFRRFLEQMNSWHWRLRRLDPYEKELTKLYYGCAMLSMRDLIIKNSFMWRPYFEWMYRLISGTISLPIVDQDITFDELLSEAKIKTNEFSMVSKTPSRLIAGNAQEYERRLMAVGITNQFTRLDMDVDVAKRDAAITIGLLMHKLMTPYHRLSLRAANKIDSYLALHFVSKMNGAKQSILANLIPDASSAEPFYRGDRNLLTEAYDAGFFTTNLGKAWQDLLYTPSQNPRGLGWAEGGMLNPVPFNTDPSTSKFLNVNQRSILYCPVHGVESSTVDDPVAQWDKFHYAYKLLEGTKLPFANMVGHEVAIGNVYFALLGVIVSKRLKLSVRSYYLSQEQKFLSATSLALPATAAEIEEGMSVPMESESEDGELIIKNLPPDQFYSVMVQPLDAITSFLLSDFNQISEWSPNEVLKIIRLGHSTQRQCDEFLEVRSFVNSTMTNDRGFTKKDRLNATIDLFSEGGRSLGPLLSTLKESLLGSNSEINFETADLPYVTLPDELSLVHRMDLVSHHLWRPLSNLFGYADKFWCGAVESKDALFARKFQSISNPTQTITQENLVILRDTDRLRDLLRSPLNNNSSVEFNIPITFKTEAKSNTEVLSQPLNFIDTLSRGFVGLRTPLSVPFVFEDQYLHEYSNEHVYDVDPRWVVNLLDYFNIPEPELYLKCLSYFEFRKQAFTVLSTSDERFIFDMYQV